jgi:hypothetical protein
VTSPFSPCLALLVSAPLLLLGCSHDHHEAPADSSPECSGDFDRYEAGMSRLAEPGGITVELEESAPAPPVVKEDNVWWLRLTDGEGAPIEGAELVVTPYMPKHLHGSAEVVVEELGAGRFKLSPIDLMMPGVWEIPVSITPAHAEASEVTFRFCIAEQ